MQPGSNRLNSNAAADRKLDAALSDIFWARRLAKQRAERSHPAERTSATTFEDSAAIGEDRAATEQMELRWISTATSRRDDRCELEDGIRSGLTLLPLSYSPTPRMSREQTAQLFASRATEGRANSIRLLGICHLGSLPGQALMTTLPDAAQPGAHYDGRRKACDAEDPNGNRIHQNEVADDGTNQHNAEAPSADQAHKANHHFQHFQHRVLPLPND
jgi:hypothetical protein